MRKNVILIDFESVQPESIEALSEEHFNVLLFVGSNQLKVSFELAASMQKMGSRAGYVKMSGNGPNALDFHIAFYIGRISSEDPTAYFHIISKDKGFDPLIQHLKTKKIYAARSEAISEIPLLKNGPKKTPKERAEVFVAKLREPKVTKPRTTKTLTSSIKAHFRDSIEEGEIPAIIEAMQGTGFLTITDGKVNYEQKDG